MLVSVDAIVISAVSQDLYLVLESDGGPRCLYVVPLVVCILVGVGKSLCGVWIVTGVISCIFSRIMSTDLPTSSYLSLATDKCHLPRSTVHI